MPNTETLTYIMIIQRNFKKGLDTWMENSTGILEHSTNSKMSALKVKSQVYSIMLKVNKLLNIHLN